MASCSGLRHYREGMTLLEINQLKEATLSFDKAIKLNNDNWEYFFYRGNALRVQKLYLKSIPDYHKALELLETDNYWVYNNLGESYNGVGEHELAIKYLKKPLQLIQQNE